MLPRAGQLAGFGRHTLVTSPATLRSIPTAATPGCAVHLGLLSESNVARSTSWRAVSHEPIHLPCSIYKSWVHMLRALYPKPGTSLCVACKAVRLKVEGLKWSLEELRLACPRTPSIRDPTIPPNTLPHRHVHCSPVLQISENPHESPNNHRTPSVKVLGAGRQGAAEDSPARGGASSRPEERTREPNILGIPGGARGLKKLKTLGRL